MLSCETSLSRVSAKENSRGVFVPDRLCSSVEGVGFKEGAVRMLDSDGAPSITGSGRLEAFVI